MAKKFGKFLMFSAAVAAAAGAYYYFKKSDEDRFDDDDFDNDFEEEEKDLSGVKFSQSRQMENKCTVQDYTEKIQKQNCIKINTLLLA